jgi:hypothetical protein
MRGRLRTLRIGAREFRWTARLCGFTDPGVGYRRCVPVRVRGGRKNGRVLLADLMSFTRGHGPASRIPPIPLLVPCAPSSTTPSITVGTLRPPAGIMKSRLAPVWRFPASTSLTSVTDLRPEDGRRRRRTSCQG